MRRPPILGPITVGCALLFGVTGCSAGSVIDVLQEDQTDQDILTIQTDLDGIDLASTRFLAERDGVEYFVARPLADSGSADTVCLLVEEGIGVGLECGPLEPGVAGPTIRDSRITAVLLPDDIDRNDLADQGFELLHPNLAIRPADPG